MADDKKQVEAITSMSEDFAQWYTDIVLKAELVDYSSVKGCLVIKPAGYAIWELIQKQLDERFKETTLDPEKTSALETAHSVLRRKMVESSKADSSATQEMIRFLGTMKHIMTPGVKVLARIHPR